MKYSIIALLTDFGRDDPYVGVVKGVILNHCLTTATQLVDLTHQITPQNIRQGAYLLRSAYRYFPASTIFLAVVDPGVGTPRRAIAIRTTHGTFVAPDNGLLSGILEREQLLTAVQLDIPTTSSLTFHGRDVFAPVAGKLASGIALESLGTTLDSQSLIRLVVTHYTEQGQTLRGEVIHIDHFGNLISSIGVFRWQGDSLALDKGNDRSVIIDAKRAVVEIAGHTLRGIRPTYGTVEHGEALALISSDGMLEIAVNGGSAADRLRLQAGIGAQLILTY